jgi:hypothetical protein
MVNSDHLGRGIYSLQIPRLSFFFVQKPNNFLSENQVLGKLNGNVSVKSRKMSAKSRARLRLHSVQDGPSQSEAEHLSSSELVLSTIEQIFVFVAVKVLSWITIFSKRSA